MAFTLIATWTAKEGRESEVLAALSQLAEPTRAEPGCLTWIPHRDPENPRVFCIYEQYESEDDYKAHGESAHFKEHGVPAFEHLESRQRAFYETLDL